MKRLALLLIVGMITMATTCERPLELEFPGAEPSLVVISNFTSHQDLMVQVSLSRTILESPGIEYLTGAQVNVFQGTQQLEQLELNIPDEGAPFYQTSDFQAEIGVEYGIQVLVPGFEEVMAMSTIPDQINLQSVDIQNLVIEQRTDSTESYTFDLDIGFQDPGNQKNFYHLKLYQQFEQFTILRSDTIVTASPTRELQFSSAINNNYQVAHYQGGILLEDTPFDGDTQSFSFPLQINVAFQEELPGQIIAELRTVSEEYYLFYSSVSRQQQAPAVPLAEPVIIFNNIKNGNGVFAGYAKSRASIELGHQ